MKVLHYKIEGKLPVSFNKIYRSRIHFLSMKQIKDKWKDGYRNGRWMVFYQFSYSSIPSFIKHLLGVRARVQIVHERNLVYDFPKLTAIRAHTDLQYREMRV